MTLIEARWKTVAHRARVDMVVIHTMEVPCAAGMAMRVANAFAKGERQVSAHYCVDPLEVIQCVRETDVAWHCPGANRRGIGIEHAGYASGGATHGATDWSGVDAQAELKLGASLVAQVCHRWGIPAVRLSVADILAGHKGIIGHADATLAFGTKGGHQDPGTNWPWGQYLELVNEDLSKLISSSAAVT